MVFNALALALGFMALVSSQRLQRARLGIVDNKYEYCFGACAPQRPKSRHPRVHPTLDSLVIGTEN